MDSRISVVTLGVADLERSRRFYETLGWKASASSNESVTFFQAGPLVLALYPRGLLAEDAGLEPEGSGFRGITLAHNLDSPEAVDALMAQAVEAGARLIKKPQPVFWGGYSGYFADPDGHLWELAHNPIWGLQPDGAIRLS